MRPFTFLHAADLHLDSPFKGLSLDASEHPAVARALRSATLDAWRRLVDLGLALDPDFVVISGDVYEAEQRSVRAQLQFREGLQSWADRGIRCFVAHGNHDPHETRSAAVALPGAVHVFGCEDVESRVVEAGGEPLAVVSGVSYRTRNEQRSLQRRFFRSPSHPHLFHVAVLHCNVGSGTGHEPYVPCALSDLTGPQADYWALGHVHEGRTLCERPRVVYPGNLQGRSVRETGPRGACLVRVAGDRTVEVEFVAADAVRWAQGSVALTDLPTLDALERALLREAERLLGEAGGRPVVCRLRLTGRGPLHAVLRRQGTLPDLLSRVREQAVDLRPFVWVERLADETRVDVGLEERRSGEGLLGQVLRVAEELRRDPAGAESLCREALAELFDHPGALRDLLPPDRAAALDLLGQAELLCAELLGEAE